MPDVYDDLRALSAEGRRRAVMLDPADVHRRGDRRRRRQVAGWAAAAMLVVAVGAAGLVRGSGLLGMDDAQPAKEPTWVQEIPSGYPATLARYVPDPGGDGSVAGPGRGVRGPFDLRPCGTPVWPVGGVVDRTAVKATLPDGAVFREVVLFADSAAASRALAEVAAGYASCEQEPTDDSGYTRGYEVERLPLGDEAVSVHWRIEFQGAPTIGSTELRWVRVGNAVALLADSSEAMSDDPAPADKLDRVARRLSADLCPFAADPCRR